MATFDLPEMPETRMSPHLLLGAASPLWAYFGAAAAGGVAYWWMTRWQPMNLEALLGGLTKAAALPASLTEAALMPATDAVETVSQAADRVTGAAAESVASALPEAPVGGEAAPISPLVETLAAPEPEARVEPVARSIAEAAAEPAAETPPEPMIEATADPLPEPAAKPRIRKGPSGNGAEA